MVFLPTWGLAEETKARYTERKIMEPQDKPTRNAGYRMETVDEDVMLFHPGKTQIHYLNPTAALIWQLCDGQRTTDELIRLLVESYPDASAEIPADVHDTLQDLINKGCLSLA